MAAAAAAPNASNNVLLIIVDNMRPSLGAYGVADVLSPNMDAMIRDATLFSRAYCQVAWCAPSRNSFLIGRRPSVNKVWNFVTNFRDSLPGAVTLPGYFLQHGYRALSVGKVFHSMTDPPALDFPQSWSEPPVYPNKTDCGRPAPPGPNFTAGAMGCELPRSSFDADAATTDQAVAWLQGMGGRPFFLAVGYQVRGLLAPTNH